MKKFFNNLFWKLLTGASAFFYFLFKVFQWFFFRIMYMGLVLLFCVVCLLVVFFSGKDAAAKYFIQVGSTLKGKPLNK